MYDVTVTKHNPYNSLTNVHSNSNDAIQDIVLIRHYMSTWLYFLFHPDYYLSDTL